MSAKRCGTLDWFVQKKRKNVDGSSTSLPSQPHASTSLPSKSSTDLPFKEKECPFNVKSLLHDPGLRTSILDYHPNLQDEIRREYISRGLCRPAHDFPQTNFGGKMRRFRYEWYQKYSWLEYSVSKDSAFCFVCYLFNDKEFNGMGGDAFVRNVFKGWNMPVGFTKHVGKKLLKLAEFYPKEFSSVELLALDSQLDTYFYDVSKDERFLGLKNIGELSIKLVELNKHQSFDLVYLLIKLVLILPVATASVERVFSGMNFVKNKLRNSIGNQILNDSLVTFIEKEVFSTVSDDDIVNRFQNMTPRKEKA